MSDPISGKPQMLEAFLKSTQYLLRLQSQQDIWEHLGKFVQTHFPAKWLAFVERGADNSFTFRYCTLPEEVASRYILTKEVRILVADVLDSGFLATRVLFTPSPSMTALLPIVENGHANRAMLIGHADAQSISAELLGIYLSLAGLAGTTTERKRAEEEVSRLNRELERRVVERTQQLQAANEELQKEIAERERVEQERRKLEEQLGHARKMEAVGWLASGVAHEFNNLLMIIRSYAELLQDRFPSDDRSRKSTGEIMKATERAASLTRQLLVFSRKHIVAPVPVDLNTLVQETAPMLKQLVGNDIDLHVTPAESLWVTEADPDQLVQVLMNLCKNARDAMPRGGRITLAIRNLTVGEESSEGQPYLERGDYVMLSITDTGAGFTNKVREHMFEPFFTTKDKSTGTGLGLSTVYGIVKQSGGSVWADSEFGHGACFTICLPRVAHEITAPAAATHNGTPRGTEVLLLVDDEEAVREPICDFLSTLGYTVKVAESGQQALQQASQHDGPIHLLITDLVMPGLNGRELSTMLGSLRPDLKTIFMSGYTDDEVVKDGARQTHLAFMQKPFSLDVLARKVREVLDMTET